ncbi:hypothetical protein [Streptomyces flaveolus]|uniref:hypothetical protein n=1 Tax=Streptomyces flaveolus TaxID=67297 RepID=UPI00340215FB
MGADRGAASAHGEILGLAYGLRDVAEFLRRAGLEDVDLDTSDLIEWRGGRPRRVVGGGVAAGSASPRIRSGGR